MCNKSYTLLLWRRVIDLLLRLFTLILHFLSGFFASVFRFCRRFLIWSEDLLRPFLGLVVSLGRALFRLIVSGGGTFLCLMDTLGCALLDAAAGALCSTFCSAFSGFHIL